MASVRPSTPARSWSRLLGVGIVALLPLTVAACSPIVTTKPYSPSDGIRVELGSSLSAANLLIISAAEGEPGVLIGGLTNSTDKATTVTLSPQGASEATVRVPAGATVLLGGGDDPPLELDTVDVAPGQVLPVTLSTPDGGSEAVSIPVLDGTLPQYADLVPTAG
ncbi:hypothetical protein [Pengzhenrongella frigida]|uniref:DNA modification methylase n=1 Tax=Pengzhenrongella frigida TaxID=1259133 RepID=A0A4Q5MZQ5_9MICO|nr:hypothetical protein [Cellulomonas sp. HLT2-17]RYV51225.1 hypothetical protein EUA98_09400 [Cellulomonas sp. HLT2-17]